MEKILLVGQEKTGEYGIAYRDIGYADDINDFLFCHIHTKNSDLDFAYAEWQGRFLTNRMGILLFVYAGGENDSDLRYFEEDPEFTTYTVEFRNQTTLDGYSRKELALVLELMGITLDWKLEWENDDPMFAIDVTEDKLKQIIQRL